MKDFRKMTDYEIDRKFPPSRIWGWIIRGAVYLGGGGFIYVVIFLVIVWIGSRFAMGV